MGQWRTYEQFVDDKLNWRFIQDPADARQSLDRMIQFRPQSVAVDFETTPSRIRLVQLGIDVPGYKPQQMVFDCNRIKTTLFAELFEHPHIEKLVHFSQFEQGWCAGEIGVTMDNVFDTCIAWQCIHTLCKRAIEAGKGRHVQRIIPGYHRHNNKLATLCEEYLGFSLPKEEQASRWSDKNLRQEQLIYAAMDVAVLPTLTDITRPVIASLKLDKQLQKRTRGVAYRARERHGLRALQTLNM